MRYIIQMMSFDDGIGGHEEAFIGPFDTRDEALKAAIKSIPALCGPSTKGWEIHELTAYDPDNLPLLTADLKGMKLKKRK
jgi:hypothetical protein